MRLYNINLRTIYVNHYIYKHILGRNVNIILAGYLTTIHWIYNNLLIIIQNFQIETLNLKITRSRLYSRSQNQLNPFTCNTHTFKTSPNSNSARVGHCFREAARSSTPVLAGNCAWRHGLTYRTRPWIRAKFGATRFGFTGWGWRNT